MASSPDKPETAARTRVRAVVLDAMHRSDLQRESAIADPALNEPRDGIPHGQWTPGPDRMPPDCPVQVLGKAGNNLYVLDTLGQLLEIKPGEFGVKLVQALFGDRQGYLDWAWPRFSKGSAKKPAQHVGFAAEAVNRTFNQAASREGMDVFDPVERVRGRGTWLAENKTDLILHTGKVLHIGGKRYKPQAYGEHVYPARVGVYGPWAAEVPDDDNPAVPLLQALTTWNFRRPVDALLILGWICSVPLAGALEHRPTIFMIGDKAVGKTTLQFIITAVLQGWLMQTPDTTAAGIYQKLGHDAIGVAVDELEAEAENFKQIQVLKLARLAYSAGRGHRGGADGTGTEFTIRSSFAFSAINAPPLEPADYSRMAVIQIDPIDPDLAAKAPVLADVDTIGPRLLRRLFDAWPSMPALLDSVYDVLRRAGHDSRGQNTFGTLIACAYLALGADGAVACGFPSIEDLEEWGRLLPAAELVEREGQEENWRGCLVHLLTARLASHRNGVREAIGDVIVEHVYPKEPSERDMQQARKLLGHAGLGICEAQVDGTGVKHVFLCVPNKGRTVQDLFFGSKWHGMGAKGVWMDALRQAPTELILKSAKETGRLINGVRQRCTLIDMDRWRALQRLEHVEGMRTRDALAEVAKR